MPSSFESTVPTIEELHELLPAYEILETVTVTPFKVIYAARQISLDREVTIKLYLQEIVKQPEFAQRFESISKRLARLKHPNLTHVFDFGSIENMLYIVMEQYPDRALLDITQGAHLSQEEATELILDISQGLELAHQADVIHGKITPQNILITREGIAKIVDFKINQSTTENPPTCYTAPEIYSEETTTSDSPSSDIYSLGIIFYELLTGCIPTDPYEPPSSIQPVLPEIDHIIARAIQPDPALRYSNISEMISDLKAAHLPKNQSNTHATVPQPRAFNQINIPRAYSTPPQKSIVPTLILICLPLLGAGGYWFYTQLSQNTNSQSEPASATTPLLPLKNTSPKNVVKSSPEVPIVPIAPPHKKEIQKKETQPENNQDKLVIIPDKTSDKTPDKTDIPKITKTPKISDIPDFDAEEFIAQTQTSLRESLAAQSILKSYNRAFLSNIKSFDRHISSAIRKIDRDQRKEVQEEADLAFESIYNDGFIPKKLTFVKKAKASKIHKKALKDQAKIARRYRSRLTKLAKSYSRELSKKISILNKAGDTQNAEILQEEIDQVSEDPESILEIIKAP